MHPGTRHQPPIERILIVEDQPDTRRWLIEAARNAYPDAAIAPCADIAEARMEIATQIPDLALIDLGLPDGDGTDLIAAIKSLAPKTLCVVASTFGDDGHVFPALRAGADGYLTKDNGQDQISQSLAGIVAGNPPLSPAIARRMMGFFHSPPEDSPDLSPRERDVLTLIGKGLTVANTANMLGIQANTVAGYVKEIYRKLEISSRAEAALKAAKLGLV